MTESVTAVMTITSHPLCPFMHAWRIALAATGIAVGVGYEARRLDYEDMPRWGELIPPGADVPWLTKDKETLWGALPVLQWFEETIPGSKLLPDDATERVRVRNRALLAADLRNTMRTVFISKSSPEQLATTEALFGVLRRCEALPWSEKCRLDWVLLAAASTILASREKIMSDPRWSGVPRMKALVLEASQDDGVVATRTAGYNDEFRAFYRAVGGTFESTTSAGG
jgi:hypothetical protein